MVRELLARVFGRVVPGGARVLREGPERRAAVAAVQSMAAIGVNAVFQLVSFLLLARAVGSTGYALVVAIAAVCTVTVEFVGLGCGDMLIRSVARDVETYARACGQALSMVALTFVPVSLVSIVAVLAIFKPSQAMVFVVALTASELISARFLALAEHICIARRRIPLANIYKVAAVVSRFGLVAVAVFVFGVGSIEAWLPWQFAYGLLVPSLVLAHAVFQFERPRLGVASFHLRDGVSFSLTQVLRSLQFSVDRSVIAPWVTAGPLANYGVAARLVQFGLLPVQAVLRLTYPHYFAHGRHGVASSRAYAFKILPVMALVGGASSLLIFVSAPWVGLALGPSFQSVTALLRILAVVPLAVAVQFTLADALTGADLQRLRTALVGGGVLATVLFVWIGARQYGVFGAGVALALVNCVFALVLHLVVSEAARRRPAVAEAPGV